MGPLENPKHERFAQEVAKDKSGRDAYRAAGFTAKNDNTADACASRLLANAKVKARVAELLEAASAKVAVTLETIATQLDEDRKLAHEQGQAGAAVSATMGKAKIYGLVVDKAKTDVTVHTLEDLVLASMGGAASQ